MFSFGHCPNYLPPPIRATCTTFLDVKNDVLARITEQRKDDYDNDVSDNCDHIFGTFDDFGVKNDQKVSNNMILMSKYKGKHGGKKGQKIRAGVSPEAPVVSEFLNLLRISEFFGFQWQNLSEILSLFFWGHFG